MTARVIMFTQPGCLSCELMRVYFEAREVPIEERDITVDAEAKRMMMEDYHSAETPTIVFVCGEMTEVIVGFDPEHLDQLLDAAPSSDSVTGT
ncbi:MAG TPA: glutaredoxin domain-containing protein [Bryobacteraceae bacterium]|nr:glutaredoxin domain-containing protein [Bryobacteraceae bacterium]